MRLLSNCFACIAGTTLLLSGCMTAPQPLEQPKTFIAQHQPGQIWVTRNDGAVVMVARPKILGDTLFGRIVGGEVISLELPDVKAVSVRQTDRMKTGLLVGAGLALAAAGATWAVQKAHGPESTACHACDGPETRRIPLVLLRIPIR